MTLLRRVFKKKEDIHMDKEILKSGELSSWVRETLKKLTSVSAKFSSNSSAVRAWEDELSKISQKHKMSVEELLDASAKSSKNVEDYDRALRLSSKIFAFKNLDK
jgi:phosphatidate phosphatase PAH1